MENFSAKYKIDSAKIAIANIVVINSKHNECTIQIFYFEGINERNRLITFKKQDAFTHYNKWIRKNPNCKVVDNLELKALFANEFDLWEKDDIHIINENKIKDLTIKCLTM